MRNFPTLLQRRFVWNAGQWPLLVALVGVFLFCSESLVGLPLAVASLVFGLRSRFAFYSVSAVVLSVFVLIGYAFFLTPLYKRIEHFVREGGGRWVLSELNKPEEVLTLASVNASVPLSDIYEDIVFAPSLGIQTL